MKTLAIIAVFLAALAPCLATAQSPQRSASAALEDLDDGQIDEYDLFVFDGCPQDDPVGVSVFEAVRDVPLEGGELQKLAGAMVLHGSYGCDYAPLDAWVAEVFDRLYSARDPAGAYRLLLFLREEQAVVKDDLKEALFRLAEDPAFGSELDRIEYVELAVFGGPEAAQVHRAVEAISRDTPYGARQRVTNVLSRGSHASTFFAALDRAAGQVSDAKLELVLTNIAWAVASGDIDPEASGLERLRTVAEERSLSAPAHIPRRARGG